VCSPIDNLSLNDPKIRIGEYIAHETVICRNPTIGLHSFRGDRKKLDRSSVDQNIYTLLLIKIQRGATVCRYLFTAKSLYMFRVSQHPSSGVLKTVTATSGPGHCTGTATSLQRGLIGPHWREVAVPILWPVPEVAVTVFSTPDDGCCDTRNM